MTKKHRQGGGRKEEAPLEIVGSSGLGQEQQREIFTPEDAEYQRYSELLKDFFEKFTRWQEILKADEYQNKRNEMLREFDVFSSPNGSYITPSSNKPKAVYDPPDRILRMMSFAIEQDPVHGFFLTRYIIHSGQATQHLLIDSDNTSLEKVEIEIRSILPDPMQSITIKTERPSIKREGYLAYRMAHFELRGDTLNVSHQYQWGDVMTDKMAANLINTIDALIPGSTISTQQPKLGVSQETLTPKALPSRRRKPGR